MNHIPMNMLSGGAGFGFGMMMGALAIFVIVAFYIFCLWKIFVKAGRPGWEAAIPFYNMYIMVIVARLPWWYVLFAFAGVIPVIGGIIALVAICIINYNVAKQFGKDIGYTIGLILLPIIFLPMLAFGDAVYLGNGAQPKKEEEEDIYANMPEEEGKTGVEEVKN